jgi:hypothetical protein
LDNIFTIELQPVMSMLNIQGRKVLATDHKLVSDQAGLFELFKGSSRVERVGGWLQGDVRRLHSRAIAGRLTEGTRSAVVRGSRLGAAAFSSG